MFKERYLDDFFIVATGSEDKLYEFIDALITYIRQLNSLLNINTLQLLSMTLLCPSKTVRSQGIYMESPPTPTSTSLAIPYSLTVEQTKYTFVSKNNLKIMVRFY